ncbi:MAG: hypothetical protein Fur0010_15960 [Bdellovibrio sp.]
MRRYIFLCAIVFSAQVMADGMIECVPQNDERFATSNKSQQMNLSEAQSSVQKFSQIATVWVKNKLSKKLK